MGNLKPKWSDIDYFFYVLRVYLFPRRNRKQDI